MAALAHAQDAKKNPTSKVYVADTEGDTQIDLGTKIDDLTKKAVYDAPGSVIETKPISNASVVLSNGTGVYFDVNTRVEVREFSQEAFRPSRTDIEDEPSVSRTQLYLDYGVIGISTSKLVPGSTMEFDTSLASAWVRGRQAVIMAGDTVTIVSMAQGEATVKAGPLDTPHLVKDGQQIIIRAGRSGAPNNVVVQDIPNGSEEEAKTWLDERILTADAARKLVYFEVQARQGTNGDISLFDGAAAESSKEIVAVPVVPVNPPIQPTVSAANLSGP